MSETEPATDSADPIQRGRALLRQRRLDDARICFEEAVAAAPHSVEANDGLATTAFLLKDYERAAEGFEASARADARRAEPLINLGAVQNRMKNYSAAIKTLQKALSRDRKNADAYFNLGVAYRASSQMSMASNAFKEAIRLRSDFAEAHQNLGLVYVEIGNTRQAVTSLKRALELCPTLSRAKAALAQATAADEKTRDRFGKLVASLPPTNEVTAGRITLSESDRSADRERIADYATRLERSLRAVLAEVQGTTEPVCHAAGRVLIDVSATPQKRKEVSRQIDATLEQCGHLLGLVDQHIQALQKHEARVEKIMQATSG